MVLKFKAGEPMSNKDLKLLIRFMGQGNVELSDGIVFDVNTDEDNGEVIITVKNITDETKEA